MSDTRTRRGTKAYDRPDALLVGSAKRLTLGDSGCAKDSLDCKKRLDIEAESEW